MGLPPEAKFGMDTFSAACQETLPHSPKPSLIGYHGSFPASQGIRQGRHFLRT